MCSLPAFFRKCTVIDWIMWMGISSYVNVSILTQEELHKQQSNVTRIETNII